MKMTVVNKCIKVEKLEVPGLGSSSLLLIGDAETIVTSSYFDTPPESLIFNPRLPFSSGTAGPQSTSGGEGHE